MFSKKTLVMFYRDELVTDNRWWNKDYLLLKNKEEDYFTDLLSRFLGNMKFYF